ncbi:hypothetical protein PG993_008556 [Apiospora rasikravindrae]|uniref:Uncharacterized protein n=1 Tax=Apiospora rasikravindrae TaxID=990691 RepID=A0ABR1T2H3_9PEZI
MFSIRIVAAAFFLVALAALAPGVSAAPAAPVPIVEDRGADSVHQGKPSKLKPWPNKLWCLVNGPQPYCD